MKKPTLQQRLRYKFDNLMSKGTMSLLLILGIITAIVVVTVVTLVGIFITSQRLSQMMRATDFVVSSRITAKMMAQIAEDGSFTIEVNPRSRAATKFSDHDDLIVVAV